MSIHNIFTILVTICCLFYPAKGDGLGDNDCTSGASQVTFECTNTSAPSIPCSQVNDGRNDCGDNSDEGFLFDCPTVNIGGTNFNQYKCTGEGTADYDPAAAFQCTPFPYDGTPNCADRSDEQKYIGDDCLGLTEDLDSLIGCHYYISNVFCNTTNQCECNPGAMAIDRGSDCQVRVYGDTCGDDDDCYDAYYGLTCNSSSTCDCKVGFYRDDTHAFGCQGNLLYENCTSDLECSNPIPNAECDPTWQVCVCDDLYIANHTDNATCPSRVLGDTCTSTAQCLTGMSYVTCLSGECACRNGSYANDDNTDCIKRLVGEACTSDLMCDIIRYGECNNDGVCDCTRSSYLIDHINSNCALGIGDLYCESDMNCTSQIDDTICEDSVCMCEYGKYAEEHQKCKKRILGTRECRNNTDCNEAVDNAVCKEGACQCASGYAPNIKNTKGDKCISEDRAGCDDFACQYPWAVVILVIGLLAIIAVVIFLLIKKPWRKPGQSSGSDKKPRKVEPVTNGGPIDPENAKPLWTLRPKSAITSMYSGNDARMQEASDPETAAFYNGGLTSVETNDDRQLSADRKVRFEPGVPSTPGNIDLEMPDSAPSPPETVEEDGDEGGEDDGGKKKKKGKKEKKGKKDKKKKKGKNKNNNAKSNGGMTQEDEDFLNSSPRFDEPVRRFSELQRSALERPLTSEGINEMVAEVHRDGNNVQRKRQLDREKSELTLAEKLQKRKSKISYPTPDEQEEV